jgi:hypothetical protein
MNMKSSEEIVIGFSSALDNDDFEEARRYLSKNCVYFIDGRTLTGADEIVNSYERNMTEARNKLDRLEWGKTEIKKLNALEYLLYFTDLLTHKGVNHVYKCSQRLRLNESGEIIEITHFEEGEERKNLELFYSKVGITS